MKQKIIFIFICFTTFAIAQTNYSVSLIPQNLTEKANTIVRSESVLIIIDSPKSYTKITKSATTVLNEAGLKNIEASEYYSNSEKVKNIEATILDASGKELKKIKQKEFRDQSIADGFSILTDNRILYLDYKPTQYPFTILYQSEVESTNTAFLPKWMPLNDYYESVQNSEFKIQYALDIGFKYKELNFEGFVIEKNSSQNAIFYKATNLISMQPEEYAPSFQEIAPNVKFGLEKFQLEGIEGNAKTWEEFGTWYAEKILNGTTQISEETKIKIKALVGNETNPIQKAKIIYNYLQEHSRYVSIQLGIGGWRPMLADDVDRLGYGDCKALSNYAKALLEVVGVPSYCTIIYGGRDERDIDKDFVSMQGNHMILAVPNGNDYIWLECTSQTDPFGFNGNFTDNRNALIIKPDGGVIIKTKENQAKDSHQIISGNYSIAESGQIVGNVELKYGGIQYAENVFTSRISDKSELDKHFKEKFSWLNDLKIENININADKSKILLFEKMKLTSSNYVSKAGNTLYFIVNLFNRYQQIPKKYRNRKFSLEIHESFIDTDEIEINLPKEYKTEFIPTNYKIESKFGSYSTSIEIKNESTIVYKRMLSFNKGIYSKEDYELFRVFSENISKNDNAKMILTQKN